MNVTGLLSKVTSNWPAKVLSVVAAILLFLFYRFNTTDERFFTLPLEIRQNETFLLSGNYPDTVRVRINGDREDIFRIEENDLQPYVDLTKYDEGGEFSAPIRIEKSGEALHVDPLEITTTPLEITISLEKKLLKVLEVVPNMEGFPAHGYELSQHYITPSEVKVEGPKSVVRELNTITTQPIDITGKEETFTIRVSLEKGGRAISFPEGNTVEFRGIIQEAVRIENFSDVDIIAMDLDIVFGYSTEVSNGEMRVQGTQLQLETIRPEQVNILIDCSEVEEPGRYLLPTIPDVPLGLLVLEYAPTEVEMRVWRMESE